MSDYVNGEYADMYLIYGRADGNRRLAQMMYQKQYLMRHHTTFTIIASIDGYGVRDPSKYLGVMQGKTSRYAHLNRSREVQRLSASPSISTRFVTAELGIRHERMWNVIIAENMHLLSVQKVHLLAGADYPLRVQFVSCNCFILT